MSDDEDAASALSCPICLAPWSPAPSPDDDDVPADGPADDSAEADVEGADAEEGEAAEDGGSSSSSATPTQDLPPPPPPSPPPFVRTPCGHAFCGPCLERVLLRPRGGDGDGSSPSSPLPTRAPCPLCRKLVSLFDLRLVVGTEEVDSPRSAGAEEEEERLPPLAYGTDADVSAWSIGNSHYEQRSLVPVADPESFLREAIDRGGVVEGHGIKFRFDEPRPSLEFGRPLRMAFDCDWTETDGGCNGDDDDDDNDNDSGLVDLESIEFDRARFHEKSHTFHGSVSFANPVRGNGGYFFDELDCLLHFSDDGRYVRAGNLRWKFAPTDDLAHPLDGSWRVRYEGEDGLEPVDIVVQRHSFSLAGRVYRIEVDGITHRPRFRWVQEGVLQTSERRILPGTSGPGAGETIEWTTDPPFYFDKIVWTRLATDLAECRRSVHLSTGDLLYMRCSDRSEEDASSLRPEYVPGDLWGNTFCQGFCVGLASYHFELRGLEEGEGGRLDAVYGAYVSYEHPKTSLWPSLDNGEAVPPRVPFRNVRWDEDARTFKGDICWREDQGTTWMGEGKWSYEMTFDPTFSFVRSGACSRSEGQTHRFGRDLIYINAALETPLRDIMQETESAPERMSIMDLLRLWRDHGASAGTLNMLGEVAMSVMGRRESVFDFNII